MASSFENLPPSQRVLKSTAAVLKKCQHVQLAPLEQFRKVAEELGPTIPHPFPWASEYHPTDTTDTSIQWMFCIDLLNFSFWDDPPYTFQSQTGYNAFCLQWKEVQDKYPILQAQTMASMTEDTFQRWFPGIPMAKERAAILKHAGQCLRDHFDGLFVNLLHRSKGSCQTFIDLVLHYFPSFRDEAEYGGEKVYFYKRAQILAADLYHLSLLSAPPAPMFNDTHHLTVFADYRIPQSLHQLGLLTYTPSLCARLAARVWETGDPMEVELRVCSVQAGELLKQAVNAQRGVGEEGAVGAMEVDFFLWQRVKARGAATGGGFHRVRSWFY